MMALYVSSHYKNSPNDLQLLADAPAHHLFVLLGMLVFLGFVLLTFLDMKKFVVTWNLQALLMSQKINFQTFFVSFRFVSALLMHYIYKYPYFLQQCS